ncbi:MAG: hypothetical protein IPP96_14950 [Chitinophagaceae bacterium]|nr:hypothetical protein [Chitinophagaceae bacterium]
MKKNLLVFLVVLIACKGRLSQKPAMGESNMPEKDGIEQVRKYEFPTKTCANQGFVTYWKKFINSIRNSAYDTVKKLSVDTIIYNGISIEIDIFIEKYFSEAFDKDLIELLLDKDQVTFSKFESDGSYLPTVPGQLRNAQGNYCIQEVYIAKKPNKQKIYVEIELRFIETYKGFKFIEFSLLQKDSTPGHR